MYNKVKKALESMLYNFTECESMEFNNGVKTKSGFRVEKNYLNYVYIEISENGDIDVWECSTGTHLYTIRKAQSYIMMFQLAWILNN